MTNHCSPDTVDAVAKAICRATGPEGVHSGHGDWNQLNEETRNTFRVLAHFAEQALRGVAQSTRTTDMSRLHYGPLDHFGPEDNDPGTAFIIHNVDDTVTIKVRSPGDRIYSEIEMPLDAWIKLRSVGGPDTSSVSSPHRGTPVELSEFQRKLDASVTAEQAAEYVRKERERRLNEGKPYPAPKDGFINDYD